MIMEGPWGPIHAYGVLILLGMITAFPGIIVDARQRKLGSLFVVDFYLAIVIGGFIGGKLPLIGASGHPANPSLDLGWSNGFVFYGSVAGALAGLAWVSRRHAVPGVVLASLALCWTPLCHAFGRFGCFVAGCCYGAPTDLSWGTHYGPRSFAFMDPKLHPARSATHTLSLHPVQLYEMVGLLGLFGLLACVRVRRGPRNDILLPSLWALGYGALRLITEMFRADPGRSFLATKTWPNLANELALPPGQVVALSASQCISLLLMAAGAYGLWRVKTPPSS
ncbi:MAG: prolipoprotein diacylglyceryl transferase family protein [Nannocystaceae bacterium]